MPYTRMKSALGCLANHHRGTTGHMQPHGSTGTHGAPPPTTALPYGQGGIASAGLPPAMGYHAEHGMTACAPVGTEYPAWRRSILEIMQGVAHELTQMAQPLRHR